MPKSFYVNQRDTASHIFTLRMRLDGIFQGCSVASIVHILNGEIVQESCEGRMLGVMSKDQPSYLKRRRRMIYGFGIHILVFLVQTTTLMFCTHRLVSKRNRWYGTLLSIFC
ncbi:hypothetical protein HanRHA438_Chr07g0319471 [Helianthus annuus]|nr:hypothetical protein HanRHA438_Chr07g0319471 [Helianthus annuus]